MPITTPNMNLIEPDVLSTASPVWASLLNNALTQIDSHDHSTGKGVKITPSGINISADLPFGSNNATTLRSVRLNNQTSFTPTSNDLACIYVLNNEIYYRDGVGNIVQITSGGSLNTSGFSLSSLTIRDSAFTLQYFADVTKQVKFDLSALSTGTTRTITIPDATSTMVNLISTQTLSNKSFDTTAVFVRSAQPINFYNSGNTFYTGIKAGNNTSNLNLTLPISAPTAGQVLVSSDIAGTLGWANTTTTVGAVAANDSNVTFTNADNRSQTCTPTATRTYTMPTTSITAGDTWEFFNTSSTTACVINASGGAQIDILMPLGYIQLRALVSTPTTAANWQVIRSHSQWAASGLVAGNFSAGFGTCSAINILMRREGDSLHLRGTFQSGVLAVSLATLALPTVAAVALSISSTKVALNNTSVQVGVPVGEAMDNGATFGPYSIVTATATSTTLLYFGAKKNNGANILVPGNGSSITTSNAVQVIDCLVPISGWN